MIKLWVFHLLFLVLFQNESFNYLPQGPQGQIIEYRDFTICYSETHEQPFWVAYELTANELEIERNRRDYLAEDNNITTGSAVKADYSFSGYDRGHMCEPNYCKSSEEGYRESYLFSNVSPQSSQWRAEINKAVLIFKRVPH